MKRACTHGQIQVCMDTFKDAWMHACMRGCVNMQGCMDAWGDEDMRACMHLCTACVCRARSTGRHACGVWCSWRRPLSTATSAQCRVQSSASGWTQCSRWAQAVLNPHMPHPCGGAGRGGRRSEQPTALRRHASR
eukprot:23185-Chlamydomonas_euryale.AAC.2